MGEFMDKKIIELINKEDKKNPLTDEEIAEKLNIFRETVTNIRKDNNIKNSRERRKEFLIEDIKSILMEYEDISDRKLTSVLIEKGYDIGKYAVGKLRSEVENLQELQSKNIKVNHEDKGKIQETFKENNNIFSAFIGYKGSLKNQISKAQAAIMYPPRGLHTLIYGPSGVGKSFLAELMHKYALGTENFGSDAPYFEFNCADYADNPQLLLAQLFGYSKGAFTGATEDKRGIVELCDGGILFLDEIHRLPAEGQEILFYLMDKGKFRRLGDIDTQRESNLMIIAATTENPESSLLLTFRRRIPMSIELPSIKERPLEEKMEFIRNFFIIESRRLGQKIYVKQEVLQCLLDAEYKGNVGQLKSDIQVCCAKSFLESKLNRSQDIVVSLESLSEVMKLEYQKQIKKQDYSKLISGDIVVFPEGSQVYRKLITNDIDDDSIYKKLDTRYEELKEQGINDKDINSILTEEVEKSLLKHIQKVGELKFSYEEISNIVGKEILQITEEIYVNAKKKIRGLKNTIIFPLAIHINEAIALTKQNKRVLNTKLSIIKEDLKDEYKLAKRIIEEINKKHYINIPNEEAAFLAMYFKNFQNEVQVEKGKIGLIIISHGRVACGMAEVANVIIGVNHAVGLEMDLKDSPNIMLEKTIDMVRKVDQGRGCIILADMGSLIRFKEPIEKATGIHVEVVGRTDTLMVIECLRKVLYTDETLESIAKDLEYKNNNHTMIKKIETTRKKAILCLCITGQGAAKKIQDHLKSRLESNLVDIEIITRGYIEDKNVESIIETVESYYDILAIVGTIDPKIERYPFMPISSIFNPEGISCLRKIIKKNTVFDENNLDEIIELDLISVNEKFNYKNQVLDNAVEHMIKKSYVKPEYLLSVYKRESLMTTFLQGGIAIPHGDVALVTKPAIFITKLDKPIIWDGINTADIIFVLALDENSKKYFEQLYKIISDETLISSIRKAKRREEILKILCKNT
jgi:transcriptional regulator with AAA-type ATPase domain/transcriptional regulatory protein LevR